MAADRRVGGQLDGQDRGAAGAHLGALGGRVVEEEEGIGAEAELVGELLQVLRLGPPVDAMSGDVLAAEQHAGRRGEGRPHVRLLVLAGQAEQGAGGAALQRQLLQGAVPLLDDEAARAVLSDRAAPQRLVAVEGEHLGRRHRHGAQGAGQRGAERDAEVGRVRRLGIGIAGFVVERRHRIAGEDRLPAQDVEAGGGERVAGALVVGQRRHRVAEALPGGGALTVTVRGARRAEDDEGGRRRALGVGHQQVDELGDARGGVLPIVEADEQRVGAEGIVGERAARIDELLQQLAGGREDRLVGQAELGEPKLEGGAQRLGGEGGGDDEAAQRRARRRAARRARRGHAALPRARPARLLRTCARSLQALVRVGQELRGQREVAASEAGRVVVGDGAAVVGEAEAAALALLLESQRQIVRRADALHRIPADLQAGGGRDLALGGVVERDLKARIARRIARGRAGGRQQHLVRGRVIVGGGQLAAQLGDQRGEGLVCRNTKAKRDPLDQRAERRLQLAAAPSG